MIKYLMLGLLCLPLFAEDVKLLDQLVSNDFEVREAATEKLGNSEVTECNKYLNKIDTAGDPELRYRFLLIAKIIYTKKIAPTTITWLTFYADVGFETETRYSTYKEEAKINQFEMISWINSESELAKQLKQNDIIAKVDDNEVCPQWQAGKSHEVTFRRYTDVEFNEGWSIDLTDKKFEEFTLKIKINKKSEVNKEDEKRMLDALWAGYYQNYLKNKK